MYLKTLSVIVVLGILLSCTACVRPTEWDLNTLEAPVAVDQFDIAVLTHDTDVDIAGHTIIYNGKVVGKGYFRYLGEWDGRYYFFGIENYEEGYFICSCDVNYADFQKHPEIHSDSFLYDGVFYYWKDSNTQKGLYAYDLRTKQERLLLEKQTSYSFICTIADGWIMSSCYYSGNDSGGTTLVYYYNIETGETVERRETYAGGYIADGVTYGYLHQDGKMVVPREVVALDIKSGKTTALTNVQKPQELLLDDNGDIWVRDLRDKDTTVLIKVAEGNERFDIGDPSDDIVDGWYYYRYRPEGGDKDYLARLNLKTGKTEYCPNIDITGLQFDIQPHYWGKNP